MRASRWIATIGAAVVALGALPAVSQAAPPTPRPSPPPGAAAGPGGNAAHGAGSNGIDKVDHVVVLMQENRSYDHYFGNLHFLGQPFSSVLPNNGNPDPTDPPHRIRPFADSSTCEVTDLDHSWNGTAREVDGGRMDGFTTVNARPEDPSGSRAMHVYDDSTLPYYYAVARTFGIGDRYFASAPTSTYPNRFFLLAATSFGHVRNDLPPAGGFDQKTIFELLDDAGVSWKIYAAQFPFGAFFKYVQDHLDHTGTIADYNADAAANRLPQVAFVDPVFIAPVNVESDEHPPANVQVGEQFSADVINTLMHSPAWGSSALFLTYDEHGGFYDHVAPPAAPIPDDVPLMLRPTDVPGEMDHYGIRVPLLVVSPFARPHFVSHVVNDHTSILKFIETRFDLPSLTRRDAAANGLLEFFDFSHASFASPPALPDAPLDPVAAAECSAMHGGNVPDDL